MLFFFVLEADFILPCLATVSLACDETVLVPRLLFCFHFVLLFHCKGCNELRDLFCIPIHLLEKVGVSTNFQNILQNPYQVLARGKK